MFFGSIEKVIDWDVRLETSVHGWACRSKPGFYIIVADKGWNENIDWKIITVRIRNAFVNKSGRSMTICLGVAHAQLQVQY
jgi:hypothetical protein